MSSLLFILYSVIQETRDVIENLWVEIEEYKNGNFDQILFKDCNLSSYLVNISRNGKT